MNECSQSSPTADYHIQLAGDPSTGLAMAAACAGMLFVNRKISDRVRDLRLQVTSGQKPIALVLAFVDNGSARR